MMHLLIIYILLIHFEQKILLAFYFINICKCNFFKIWSALQVDI